MNTQKSESKFIKKFKEIFGGSENKSVLIGDWSRTSLRYQTPTKGSGCKGRSLETLKERKHPNPSKKDKLIKAHGLLRCKNENCKQMVNEELVERLWNRDDVATLNMKDVVESTVLYGVKPVYLS